MGGIGICKQNKELRILQSGFLFFLSFSSSCFLSFTFDFLRLHLKEPRKLKSEANKALLLRFQIANGTGCSLVCFHFSIFCW